MIDWEKLVIDSDASVLAALQVIDHGALQFALVVRDGLLLGMVTDGDIRRALVSGLDVQAPVCKAMNSRPVVARVSESPLQWRRLIRDRQIRHLPVVDEEGRLVRVVDERSCTEARENWAVVMAGGLGTRLRPITEQIPKPMIEIGGTPILEIILRSLAGSGISRIYFAVNYRADVISDYFGDGSRWNVQVEYLQERMRLGTAGALSLLPEKPGAPVLVMNGDILTGQSLGEVLDAHVKSEAAATMCIREYATQIPYGVVEIQGTALRGIREKPIVTHMASAGMYVLSPECLQQIPSDEHLDMPSLFQSLIASGRKVQVHQVDSHWIDIGRIDDLERARLEFGNLQK